MTAEGHTSGELLLYAADTGQLEVRLNGDSIWLTHRQMSELFQTTTRNVQLHLQNIFTEGELDEGATTKDFFVVQTEGKRRVRREITHYNLDAILSVGYRVSSKRAVQFRQWATRTLNDHLVRGYTLNRDRFEHNARELEAALQLVRKAAASPELSADTGQGLIEVISRYTQTFLWLQRYDEGLLDEPKGEPGGTLLSAQQYMHNLQQLKAELIARGEATELFAQPRGEGLAALLGNLDQTVFGEPAYPSIEAKAAHLLYFVVKNHPFSDGNKRSGAYLFVDFLGRNGRLLNAQQQPVINDTGLAALTLLVAESKPEQKDTLIRLIMHMLAGDSA